MDHNWQQVQLGVCGVLICLYFFYVVNDPGGQQERGPIWSKISPIWLLAMLVYNAASRDKKELRKLELRPEKQSLDERRRGITFQYWIIAGLLISSVGDALLEVETTNPLYFIGGLLFFLIAHICYIKAFYVTPFIVPVNMLGSMAVFLVGFCAIVLPHVMKDGTAREPDIVLRVAICIYGAAIATMTLSAANRYFVFNKSDNKGVSKPSTHSSLCAGIGALVFMSSDCVIAINKFVVPVKFGKFIVMITYYAGQFLIARSAINVKPVDPKKEQ